MIDYKEAKKHLIPALQVYGFSERKDKSCRSCRVFSNGSEILLVKSNRSGVYDYYSNKSVSDDYGDTVGFIIRRELNKSYHLTAEELGKVESVLAQISNQAAVKEQVIDSSIMKRQLFDISRYTIDRLDMNNPPKMVQQFFEQRGIDVCKLGQFKASIGALVSDKGLKQPLFYWQNMDGQIVGAQYKFIKDGACIKRFLAGTDRTNSLWMTPIGGKVGLFITEDPLDAIAHSQLFPAANVAYCCSGGTTTKRQREMIHEIAEENEIPIILGNDNDLAGQLENYKLLVMRDFQYMINKADNNVKLVIEGQEVVWQKEDLVREIENSINASPDLNIELKLPREKDWNDDLKKDRKSASLRAVEKGLAKSEVIQEANGYGMRL